MKLLIYVADDCRVKRAAIVGLVKGAAKFVFQAVDQAYKLEVIEFTCGNDVIAATEKKAPDLVVTDWCMARGGGVDVVGALWKKELSLWVFSGEEFGVIHQQIVSEKQLGPDAWMKVAEHIFCTPSDTERFSQALREFFEASLP